MKKLNLYKLWKVMNKLSYEEAKLAEEQGKWVSLLGRSSGYITQSFENFLNYYSFKIEDDNIVVFNNEPVSWEDFNNSDFSYVPSFLLFSPEKEIKEWIKTETEKQLKQQEDDKIQEKYIIREQIKQLEKRLNN